MSWLQEWKQVQKIKQAAKEQGVELLSPKQKAKKDYEKLVEKYGKPKSLGDYVANYAAPKPHAGGYYNKKYGPAPGSPGTSKTGIQTIPQFKPKEDPKPDPDPTPAPPPSDICRAPAGALQISVVRKTIKREHVISRHLGNQLAVKVLLH